MSDDETDRGTTDRDEGGSLSLVTVLSVVGLRRLVSEVAQGVWRDDCLGLAAEIAYFGLFSLFPFLLFLRALVPYLPGTEDLVARGLDALAALVSTQSKLYQIVSENIIFQVQARNQALLSLGALLTLWSASSVFGVLVKSLNRAYNLVETRGLFHRRALALVLTLVMMLFVPVGFALLLIGPSLGHLIGLYTGRESEFDTLWGVVRWPLVFGFLTVALAFIYYYAPNIKQRWHWLTPGSLFAVGAIVLESLVLSRALGSSMFAPEWLTFGAIGAVIIIIFWLYLIGFSILVGAEINAALERVTGRLPGRS